MRAAWLACVLAGCLDRAPATADAAGGDGGARVACDGALCATDNGSTCDATVADPRALAWVAASLIAIRRRRR